MRIDDITARNSVNWTIGKNEKNSVDDFSSFLKRAVSQAKELNTIDYKNSEMLAMGQMDYLHRMMIDTEKADIALQFTLQVRNKIMDAYQEIMRMQI